MELKMDDELRRELAHFDTMAEKAKHGFGEWDALDPVAEAILRVVQAQNDFAHAIGESVAYGGGDDAVEAAIEKRRKAIVALTGALASEPRGYQ
jgi:ADP-ribosylglycohydrolase